MKLLFDIGNTRIKWACFSDDHIHSMASLNAADADSIALQDAFRKLPKPDSIWVSNVGSLKVLNLVCDSCNSVLKLEPNIVKVSKVCRGINNKYLTQDTLGVDRWLAAVGARAVVPEGHVIIIDAGTAVKVDWLSAANAFEGGVIFPGYKLMLDALVNNTAGIQSGYSDVKQIVGRTTEECVNSGVTYSLIGAIERIVKEMQQSIDEPTTIVLTGGSASMIKSMTDFEVIVQNDLVLLGVAQASLVSE